MTMTIASFIGRYVRLRRIMATTSTRPTATRAREAPTTSRRRRSTRTVVARRAAGDDDVTALVSLRGALEKVRDARDETSGAAGWSDVCGARVLSPTRARPWGMVHFIGGAVLGGFPDVAYDALLRRCVDELGLCVVATPYELDLDHDACARACGKAFREARMEIIDREGLASRATPTFRVGHSLGCKLATLLACEEDERDDGTIEMDATSGTAISTSTVREDSVMCVGNFMIGFNNADAAESAKLIEKFARELLKKRADASGANADFFKTLPSIAAFAERAAKAAGLEFTPTPEETLARARRKFVSPRTRLVKLKDDDLDQNAELLEALQKRFEVYPGKVDSRELDFGNHLTPVYFSTDGLKLTPALEKLMGKFSLGDEEGVRKLSEELSAFIRSA